MTLTMVQLGSIALWSPPMLKVSPIVWKIKPKTVNKKPENFGRKLVGTHSGSAGSKNFWASRIRIRHYLYGSGSINKQKVKKNLDF
jgi:hypothetical protein